MATATKTRKGTYRALLVKKRNELLASVRREPDALATSIQTPDADEFAVKSAMQDVTAVTLDLRSRMLKDIERSLKQIAEGTYGLCEGCGEEISSNRLQALPWARYCLACQELRSRN
jgi:RNA polymerase-binding transcription factor